jgi:hypothetical protein
MIVLMDVDQGINAGHKMNPQQIPFFNPDWVNNTDSHRVSMMDFQFRDPWGNPYVISLDASRDYYVRDACYASPRMSANGITGLLTNANGLYELKGSVMIWSRGPDGKFDVGTPGNAGVNKDNVISWR